MDQSSLSNFSPSDLDQLGGFVREYRTGSRRHKITLTIFLIFFALLFGLALFIMIGGLWSGAGMGWVLPTIIFVVLSIFPGVGVVSLIRRFAWKAYLFENGFILERGQRRDRITWEKVRHYYEKLIYVHGVESDHMLILELHEGGKIHFDSMFQDIAILAKSLKRNLSQFLLDKAEENLSRGEKVTFELLVLSPDGLETKGKQIHWHEISNVALEPSGNVTRVVIRKKGDKKPWFTRAVPAFPNVEVFLRLASRFMEPE